MDVQMMQFGMSSGHSLGAAGTGGDGTGTDGPRDLDLDWPAPNKVCRYTDMDRWFATVRRTRLMKATAGESVAVFGCGAGTGAWIFKVGLEFRVRGCCEVARARAFGLHLSPEPNQAASHLGCTHNVGVRVQGFHV